MAGDWIKLRNDLPRDARLFRIARECAVPITQAIGACVMLWTTASDTTEDGLLPPGVEDADIDHMGMLPGLSKSLRTLGWLEDDETGRLRLPNFSRYIGSAKERAAARERQRDSRAGRVTPNGRDKPPLSQNVTVTKRDCHIENENEIEKSECVGRGRAGEAAPGFQPHAGTAIDQGRAVWDAWCIGNVLPKAGKHNATAACRDAVQVIAARDHGLEAAHDPQSLSVSLNAARDWLIGRVTKWRESPLVRNRGFGWQKQCQGWMNDRRYDDDECAWNDAGSQGGGGTSRTFAGRTRGPNPNGTAGVGGAGGGQVPTAF